MEGRAWRAPSFCEVWRRFRKPGWLSSTQIARKGAKSSRSSNPRVGNVRSPLGTVRHQPFLSGARPKVGGRGSQRARGEPRGHEVDSFFPGGTRASSHLPGRSHSRGDGIPVVDKFRFPSELFHCYILVAFPSSMKI